MYSLVHFCDWILGDRTLDAMTSLGSLDSGNPLAKLGLVSDEVSVVVDEDVSVGGVVDAPDHLKAVLVEDRLERPELGLVEEDIHDVSLVAFTVYCKGFSTVNPPQVWSKLLIGK
jgi:hypothetical protein